MKTQITITAHILSYSWMCPACESKPDYEPQSEKYRPQPEDGLTCDDCGAVYGVGDIEVEDV